MLMQFLRKRQNKELLKSLITELSTVRSQSSILALCARPTGYSWLGVNVATRSLFPHCTLEIPQEYSHSVFNEAELSLFAHAIRECKFDQVIISGFAPFYEDLVLQISGGPQVKIVYHGFLSELSDNQIQQKAFATVLRLAQNGSISAIGCVKKGLSLSLAQLYGVRTHEIILPNHYIREPVPLDGSMVNIGCMVNTSFRKNIHNQAVAGLLINNSKVHVFDTPELAYLPQDRLCRHSLMDHSAFLSLIGSMSINLHVTFSEGMGGQVCAESIAQGVPCLSAYTSSFFDYDDWLKSKLIVDGFDDSWFIYKKIESVLSDYEPISKRCVEYAKELNVLAEERLGGFLSI